VDRSPNSSVRAGNQAATHEHDFLSLYAAAAKDAPLLLHDSKAPPPVSQGLHLHVFFTLSSSSISWQFYSRFDRPPSSIVVLGRSAACSSLFVPGSTGEENLASQLVITN